MAYSSITLEEIQTYFGVKQTLEQNLFKSIAPRPVSELLSATLAANVELALSIRTEKARSEFIIAPVLSELRKQAEQQISIFSGTEFNVDEAHGLNGRCDFLVSRSPYQLLIESPIVIAVEAKQDDFDGGTVQCIAEMIAARIFNEQKGNLQNHIYGIITNGQLWKFAILDGVFAKVEIDFYEIEEIEKIMGILWAMTFDEITVA